MSRNRIYLGGLAIALIALIGRGQVSISGVIADGGVGPLLSGVTYNVTGNITVAAGTTLTVQPGAILKFGIRSLTVNGTLLMGAPGGADVILTSDDDDTVGIDLTAAATMGAPGQWFGVTFNDGSDASVLENVDIRFAGASSLVAVQLTLSNVTMRGVTIHDCAANGIAVTNGSMPTIDGCDISTCDVPITVDTLDQVVGISGCTASGNLLGDTIRATTSTIGGVLTLTTAHTLNGTGVYFLLSNLAVQATGQVNLEAGVIIKFIGVRQVIVNGILNTSGTAGAPVVFSTSSDDAVGGDSLNDGPTVGTTPSWFGILFNASAPASNLSNARVRFAGTSSLASIAVNNAALTLEDCIVEKHLAAGITVASGSLPQITGCHIDGGTVPIALASIMSMPGLAGNSAENCSSGNSIRITNSTLTGNLMLSKAQTLDATGEVLLAANLNIPAGQTLGIAEGFIVKFLGVRSVIVTGTLMVSGTTTDRVTFTSDDDDAVGTDALNDGPTSGAAGQWFGMDFAATSDGSVIEHAVVRFAGTSSLPAIDLSQADVLLDGVHVQSALADGLRLTTDSFPMVRNCAFDGCNVPISGVSLAALAGFRDNTATGNAAGNVIRTAGTMGGALAAIGRFNLIDDTLVVTGNINVAVGQTLEIGAGVILKFIGVRSLVVNGSANIRGTGFDRVTITTASDDAVGGDALNDGPTVGAPGSWFNVDFNASAVSSSVSSLDVRFAGTSSLAAFVCDTAALTIRSIRAHRCQGDGFQLGALAGDASNLVAEHCGGDGVQVSAGTFDIVHATLADNGSSGVRNVGGWNGEVRSTIASNNTAGNYIGLVVAQLFASNGSAAFAGTNGNIDLDPLFVDASGSDYRLQATSPSLGAAEFATAFLHPFDHDDRSRVLDHALSGSALPDMGAFERDTFSLSVDGEPRTGTTLSFTTDGALPGLCAYFAGILDGSTFYAPFGILNAGRNDNLLHLGVVPTGFALPAEIPFVPALEGFVFGVQAVAVSLIDPTKGDFTASYRATIFN